MLDDAAGQLLRSDYWCVVGAGDRDRHVLSCRSTCAVLKCQPVNLSDRLAFGETLHRSVICGKDPVDLSAVVKIGRDFRHARGELANATSGHEPGGNACRARDRGGAHFNGVPIRQIKVDKCDCTRSAQVE